ncbi:MAG: YfgM family protein [Endomicrobiales bacterium]
MSDISRHQLKKNELADFVVAAVTWIRENRSVFLSVAGTCLLILALGTFFLVRLETLKVRAADRLSMAEGMMYQGQPDQGLKLLDEIITRYSRTVAASRARMVKADYLVSRKQYDDAEKAILPVVENGVPKTIIPLAMSVLGTIREDAGKYKEAIALCTSFLDTYPEHFLAPRIYESLGRLYELSGSTAEAKATYEKLATLYPASPWAQQAQERVTLLARKTAAPQSRGAAGTDQKNQPQPSPASPGK